VRIVDRKTFLALPAGTVFAKHDAVEGVPARQSLCFDEVAIKGDTVAGVDFVVQGLFPLFEGVDDCSAWSDVIAGMFDGQPSPPLDYHYDGRDGLFDQDQLFAVWDVEDHRRLIARLQEALAQREGKAA
jgi:hypothetical protein